MIFSPQTSCQDPRWCWSRHASLTHNPETMRVPVASPGHRHQCRPSPAHVPTVDPAIIHTLAGNPAIKHLTLAVVPHC